VVLPDEKDDKKDVVVFLDASQATAVEEDAQQAGRSPTSYTFGRGGM